jgi:dolichyl-diphosphooligosaccharide--protein glycosyltransferase
MSDIKNNKYVKWISSNYHIPTVITIFIVAVLVRMSNYSRFITEDGIVFSGNDPWYHYRQTRFTFENWPFTMKFDPYTGYPVGFDPGHFGTLYDQILATVSLVASLFVSNPVKLVMIFAPPFIAGFACLALFYLGWKIKDRITGILAMTFLAIMPSVFFSRGLVGVADHNIAEPLFMTISVIGIYTATQIAERESFVLEIIYDFDKNIIKKLVYSSLIISLSIFLFIAVWPPGVLMIGLLGIFYAINSLVEYYKDNNTEPVLLQGILAGFFLTVLNLVFLDKTGLSTVHISYLQVIMSIALTLGSGFLLASSRYFRINEYMTRIYIAFLSLVTAVTSVLSYFLIPNTFNYIVENFFRFIGLGTVNTQETIREAIPLMQLGDPITQIFSQYRFLLFIAILGVFLHIIYNKTGKDINNIKELDNSPFLFVIIWFVFTILAGLTQVRFNYYLSLTVALFSAYCVVLLFEGLNLNSFSYDTRFSEMKGYQVIALILIIVAVFAPLMISPNFVDQANSNNPGGYTVWSDSLEWVEDNTPEYESIEYDGNYDDTKDYDYEDDVYGIMSWWDYGHWITVASERVPVANPFQQHAEQAAKFLLSNDEDEALDSVSNLSDESNVRYVMIDWQTAMPTQKFQAPTVWNPNTNTSDFFDYPFVMNRNKVAYSRSQRFYESMVTRLYTFHGSASRASTLVADGTIQQGQGNRRYLSLSGKNSIKKFNTIQRANEYVEANQGARRLGFGTHPPQKVDALENYRLVHASDTNALRTRGYGGLIRSINSVADSNMTFTDYFRSPSAVKTFERVDGADIEGSGAHPNSQVSARVIMETQRGSSFLYQQFDQSDENGDFNMTLPYSTTGYNSSEEYTNVSTRASGNYTIFSRNVSGTGNNTNISTRSSVVEVPERSVVEEENDIIEVELEED